MFGIEDKNAFDAMTFAGLHGSMGSLELGELGSDSLFQEMVTAGNQGMQVSILVNFQLGEY